MADQAVYDPLEGFDQFWTFYPWKAGKDAAREAWVTRRFTERERQVVLEAVLQQLRWPEWTRDNGHWIPLPATWLNQGRWQDEPHLVDRPLEATAAEMKQAIEIRRAWGRCRHDPCCQTYGRCLAAIVASYREG